MNDSRLAISTLLELAELLQGGRSAYDLLPQIARILTRLVPAREVELMIRGAALRCEVAAAKARDAAPHPVPDKPSINGGRATIPLTINNTVFGAITVERSEPFTPLEAETLIDASRVLSLGLWSRLSQPPRA